MATIKQYRLFKAELLGYVDMPFNEFRNQVVPLIRRRDWSDDEIEYVNRLVSAGCGRALQRLFSSKHPTAVTLLGVEELAPLPMVRAELDQHMRALTNSFISSGWSADRITAFAMYLESGLSPSEYAASIRDTSPGDTDTNEVPPPSEDRFANMYRSTERGSAFRRCTLEHIALAAANAKDAKDAKDANAKDAEAKSQ